MFADIYMTSVTGVASIRYDVHYLLQDPDASRASWDSNAERLIGVYMWTAALVHI